MLPPKGNQAGPLGEVLAAINAHLAAAWPDGDDPGIGVRAGER
jgi:hypothetical protein